ncbi:hypothetical protein [Cohnella lupini]|uniref:Flagellar operon protein (TIGR03826 family) n=1 Tax=Cohnella lupini TaxID=1294267 RepID=A0A3D9IAF8_9BACL|nr:hypothetical protein [Cohnella lupini]RED58625.1 hypothetical protein DFP95_108152 [Cohnella lupini]
MELVNCGRCGKLQVQRPDTLCKECQQIYVAEAQIVKNYIKSNPGATIMDVVQFTGYPMRRINEILER